MQSDVLNEQQQPLSNDIDCSSALTSNTTTTLIYSGLKLHPKPLVPTISMPGVASPLSIVKKLSIPDAHLDSSTSNVRHASSTGATATTTTPSAIRLVTPTGKSSPPTNLQFQRTEKSSTNGGFSTSKTYFLNPQQSSTATVTKPQILPSATSTPSLVTLIPPGTTSPKIQTLNSVTISSTNDAPDKPASTNSNQPVFLSKNRVTLVQPLIATANSASVTATATNAANSLAPKLVIQQNATPVNATTNFWQQPQTAQATKIFSIPPSSILPTAKMLSRPVQLIPTSLSSAEHHHHHHHPHITHVQTVKSEKADAYPISMHFGLSSPTTENSLTPLNVQVQHPHAFATKAVDSAGHQTYFHMQLLPSTANSDALTAAPQPVQFTLPATHLYSSSSSVPASSVLISTTQRSMDHNNNHQSTTTTITTPIIREMQTDEKLHDSAIIKTLHHNKVSSKNRPRLPLQPSTQQTAPTSATLLPSSSSSSSTSSSSTTIRQPKKHKLIDDDHSSSVEPPSKVPHYEQLDSSSNLKKLSNARNRPLAKFSAENTTPNSPVAVDTSALAKKRPPTSLANASLAARKRRAISKPTSEPPSNENVKQESAATNIHIEQIDDELLRRLSQDFVYVDKQSGLRWIGTKSRPKAMSSLVSRFSWKPKINHYEKYSDIIRTNPKRTVPVKTVETIRKSLSEPWAAWRIDRLTTYLAELNDDEQTTQNQLSDILQSLQIDDQSVRTAVEDLFEANFQRHRCFCDQLTQISSVLLNILDHGNNLREICAVPKPSASKRTKER